MARKRQWQHFSHAADVGVRGLGETPARAFEQAALAMTAAITDPGSVRSVEAVPIRCEAPDAELLLVDWLNAIVYEMATRKMLFGEFHVAIEGNSLSGRAAGEPIDIERHRPAVEVKGATQTALGVRERPDGTWVAECVIDV